MVGPESEYERHGDVDVMSYSRVDTPWPDGDSINLYLALLAAPLPWLKAAFVRCWSGWMPMAVASPGSEAQD
jgi:hypothetical protein